MPIAPLADCTLGSIQEANKANNMADGVMKKKVIRTFHTHNPYSRVILTPLLARDLPSEKKQREANPNTHSFIDAEVPWDMYTPFSYSPVLYTDEAAYGYNAYGSAYHNAQFVPQIGLNSPQPPYQPIQESTASVNTSSIADKAVNLSNSNASCGNTGTSVVSTPLRQSGNNIYKMYVDGRPKVVRGIMYAEVRVELRLGGELFVIEDVPRIFGIIVRPEELVGRYVIVEGDRGEDMGRIVSIECCGQSPAKSAEEKEDKQLLRVLRDALPEEIESFHALTQLEAEALEFCKNAIHTLKMRTPLQVQRAVFQFDRKKLTFTYSSESYVEFKSLLRTLNRQYQCRIWMHQLNWEANCRQRRHSNETNSHSHSHNNNNNNDSNNNRKIAVECRSRIGSRKAKKRINETVE